MGEAYAARAGRVHPNVRLRAHHHGMRRISIASPEFEHEASEVDR